MSIYPTEYGWACAWERNSTPTPFIMVYTISDTRQQAIAKATAFWMRESDEGDHRKTWRRMKRAGMACIRVSVQQAFFHGEPADREGRA